MFSEMLSEMFRGMFREMFVELIRRYIDSYVCQSEMFLQNVLIVSQLYISLAHGGHSPLSKACGLSKHILFQV